MRILKYISIFFLISFGIFYFMRSPDPYQVISGQTMGTYYTIKVKSGQENKLLNKYIAEELKNINQQMSVFDNNSEIAAINKSANSEWIELSPEMQTVLKSSHNIYNMSRGSFDPTVGKLVDLWGFGTTKPKRIPTDEEIKETLKNIGFNKLIFSSDFSKVKKENPNVILNLSAIAKGYGVDKISELLKKLGYEDFVVEIGGEVYASGQKSDDIKGWKIGVVEPSGAYNENAYIITLKDMAAATSGDYRNFIYVDDKKFSHTISPQNGYPVNSNLVSVTVFDKNCMTADGLSTAMMAMGEKKAIDFANRNNIATILFVRNDDNSVKAIISEKAKKLIGK